MKSTAWAGILIAGTLTLAACGSSSSGETLIDPANQPEDLAKGITVKIGDITGVVRNSKDAPIPDPSTDPAAPTIQTAPSDDLDVANGDTAKADVVFNSDNLLTGLFAKVVGADSYVEFSLGGAAKAARDLSIDITVPANTRDGRFCIDIVARDVDGLVSQPTRICYQIRSDRDDENTATGLLSQLQGEWIVPCQADDGIGSFRSILNFKGSILEIRDLDWDEEGNNNCSGTGDGESGILEIFDIQLGPEVTTSSGIKARELDLIATGGEDNPTDSFTLVRIDNGELLLADFADTPALRPSDLDFNFRSTRYSSANTPSTDNTPLGDQTWSFSTSIKGSVNGQNVDQTLTDFEVSGLDVPQDSNSGEQEAVNLSEAYSQALQQGCENGFQENQPTRIDNFAFTQNGNGGVGSVIEGRIDIFIDGVCRNSDGDTSFDIDAMYSYRAERIS